jgi:methylenetetrahydrofolate dehydrogenase (NADP+)/methenyltetrahydrofolate cyclohydrolase
MMDGRPLAEEILGRARVKVAAIKRATGAAPVLATVLVGDDPASAAYVRLKGRRCDEVGIASRVARLSTDCPTEKVVQHVRDLGGDSAVHGILVQHPVPRSIDRRVVFEAIPPEKDVDGATSAMLGRAILGLPALKPCTPAGIMQLLRFYGIELDGTHAVVIGRSPILGRPLASMLINAHATVTLCHSRTRTLPVLVRQADLIIAAVGRPRFVSGEWIKPGAVVVDAGYNEGAVGDVDFEAAVKMASWITPVPGGVGPMTIATLVDQTANAAAAQLAVTFPSSDASSPERP